MHKKLMYPAALGVCIFFLNSYSHAIDCKITRTTSEKTICKNTDLLRQDEELNKIYSEYISYLAGYTRIRAILDQNAWLKIRDTECGEENSCIYQITQSKIEEIKALVELNRKEVAAIGIPGDWEPIGKWCESKATCDQFVIISKLPNGELAVQVDYVSQRCAIFPFSGSVKRVSGRLWRGNTILPKDGAGTIMELSFTNYKTGSPVLHFTAEDSCAELTIGGVDFPVWEK